MAGVPAPLSASHLLDVLRVLDAAGIAVSIEGGWGVDALLGRQTRDHADVDLALERNDCEAAASALAARGYRHDMSDRPGLPARFVLKNEAGTPDDTPDSAPLAPLFQAGLRDISEHDNFSADDRPGTYGNGCSRSHFRSHTRQPN